MDFFLLMVHKITVLLTINYIFNLIKYYKKIIVKQKTKETHKTAKWFKLL